jgi:hypothetical protein
VRALLRTAWFLLAALTLVFAAGLVLRDTDAVRSIMAEVTREPTRTWADVGAKLREFSEQQPLDFPGQEEAPGTPPP